MFGTGPKGHRETISPSAGRSLLVFHEKTESGGSQYWLATLWYFASASQHELESDSSRVKRCRGVLAVPQVPSHQKKPAPTAQLRFWQNPASPPPPLGLLYRVSASFLSYSTYCCIMALKLANSASSGSCSSVESLRLPPVCCSGAAIFFEVRDIVPSTFCGV